jgi:amino acid adenylation domain-containing protein
MPIHEPTVANNALSEAKRRLLAQRLKGAASPTVQPGRIQPRPAGARTVISPDQYNIWLDATLQPDLPTYNEIVTVRYRGDINPALLEQSFNAFLARHEGWRTTFSVDQGEVLQVVHPEFRLKIDLIDLTSLPLEEREAESTRLATQQALVPFNLEQFPLIRTVLVRMAPDDCRLHLVLAHIIFDGFSLRRTFLPELAAGYEALQSGKEIAIPAPELQYGDFAAWRHQQTGSPAMQGHLDYWRKQLAGDLPLLRLPTDRPRPPAISHRGDIERFIISRELTERLRTLGLPYGASFYMTLLASFKALLFRYSGQEDVVIGSVADGRRRPELDSMMGYILDIFALRTHPAASMPFTAYLRQVRQTVLDALAHAEAPFERVVEAVGGKRDLSHQPIFQTLFIIEPTPQPNGLWDIAATEITIGATKVDLYVEADEHPEQTTVSIDYSTDLFDAATIRRMIGHWSTLIEAICATPDCALGDLPLLTAAERETMLVRWNDTAVPVPATTMHGLVEAQVAKTPNAPAVGFENTTLTYAQLDREANRLAHHLRLAGASADTLAAIFLDRSQYLVAGLIGVLKTGAAYLPLDPGTPAARIALCLEDAEPAVILTQRSRLADLPATAAKVLILEDILAAPYPAELPASAADPDALAYVIHTSGSTGRPKGVELKHQGVVNLLLSMQREPGFTAADTLVAVTTISFDIAVLELFLPLITGGKVVVASRETALDPTALAALIRTSNCSVLQATPATWSALLGIGWQGQKNLKALCGGEALNRSLADRLLALNLELWNVYGPTETTIWSTVRRVQPGTGPIAVGRPIANTTAYLLDGRRQPVPVGVPGELYLGGIGLARGYRNKPALTAEKFVAPAIADSARLYRTGDYAVYRADGAIEIQGRSDNQVKVRGYRIELEDVEVNLTAHPQVAFAAAKAWPDPDGGHRLCAYFVGVSGPSPSSAELRQFLRGRVADYMIPSDIVALDRMPLTSNGKIDRKQLPQPERNTVTTLVNPELRNEELRLSRIWAELLRVDHITATDNFFDLGGHSLMLLKLIRLIDKEFDIQLEITRLFQSPTIETLAKVVRELTHQEEKEADDWNSLVPLNPRGTRRPFFLVHSLMLYGRLPAALGDDQPFYGLQQLPFEEDNPSADKTAGYVDQMLEDHIRQIKRVQPHGPYQIAGWCFAGFLAYEVARRLEAGGDQVSMLVMLDSWCPYRAVPSTENAPANPAPSETGTHAPRSRLSTLFYKIDFRARQFLRLSSAERGSQIRRMVRDLFSSLTRPIQLGFRVNLYRLCLRFHLPMPAIVRDSNIVVYDWLRHYRVQPYRGDITLVRPGDIAVPPGTDPACGWRPLTSGNIHSAFVPGDRSTMFLKPNLTLLADALRNLMTP